MYNTAIAGAAISGILLFGGSQIHAATTADTGSTVTGSTVTGQGGSGTTTASTSYASTPTSTATAGASAQATSATSAATSTANAVITPQYSAASTAISAATTSQATSAAQANTPVASTAPTSAVTSTASQATESAAVQSAATATVAANQTVTNATSTASATTDDDTLTTTANDTNNVTAAPTSAANADVTSAATSQAVSTTPATATTTTDTVTDTSDFDTTSATAELPTVDPDIAAGTTAIEEPTIEAAVADSTAVADTATTSVASGDLSQAGATLDSAAVTSTDSSVLATSQAAPVVNANDESSLSGDNEATTSILVKYVDADGNAVADAVELMGTNGLYYEAKAALVSGYNLVSTPTNATGTYGNGTSEIVYTYVAATSTLTVKYVATDGTVLDTQVLTDGAVGDSYQTTAERFDNYALAVTPMNFRGTLNAGENTVTYVYKSMVAAVDTTLPAHTITLGVDPSADEIQAAKDAALADYLATGRQQIIAASNAAVATQPDNTGINASVAGAKSSGVIVHQDETQVVTADTLADAQAQVAKDYAAQEAAIAKVKAAQDKNMAAYQADLAAYYADNQGASNFVDGLTTADVSQQLVLGREPQADVAFATNGQESRVSDLVADPVTGIVPWASQLGTDSPHRYDFTFPTAQSGQVITATYTNLQASKYVDANGVTHKIAKIVRTFSDLSGPTTQAPEGSKPMLEIFNDPTDGFNYDFSTGVTVTDAYYDEYGNALTLDSNTAYITVSSLNADYQKSETDSSISLNAVPKNVETATGIDNAIAEALVGSSIKLHSDNSLYADATNLIEDDENMTTWKSKINWDSAGNVSTYQYYGAGLFNVDGSSYSIRFSKQGQGRVYIWAQISTTVPLTTPNKPWNITPLKTSYHLDTIEVNPVAITKQADQAGKTLVAGDTTTTHISQDTGIAADLTDWYIGDAIVKQNNRLPVSYDLSKFTVTANSGASATVGSGTDVTDQGKFVESNIVINDQAVRLIQWIPNDINALADYTTYTMNTVFTTTADGISDDEVDFGYNTYGVTQNYTSNEYTQTTDKHWVEGSQSVDNKTTINGDEITAQVAMSLPDPASLAQPLSKVEVVDDYSKFADDVTYAGAKVLENGIDVSADYKINNANGKVTATRITPATTPDGTVNLVTTFKVNADVKNATQLLNNGSGTLNTYTKPTPEVPIVTYTPDTQKNWVAGTQSVNNKIYIAGDAVNANVNMSLPDPTSLAVPLSNVQVADDYTKFADLVDYQSAKVLENGIDVSAKYNINNANGVVTATRSDPASAPDGNVSLQVSFKIHQGVANGTQLLNNGSGTLNTDKVPTPEVAITTYEPGPEKHWTEGDQVVDGKTYISGDTVHGTVSMALPDPAQLAEPLTKVQVTDDFTDFADKVDYDSATVLENGKDATADYTLSVADGIITATRNDASKAPGGEVQIVATFTLHTDVKDATVLTNAGTGTLNTATVPTNTPSIVTYVPATDKHWVEGSQNVDNKIYINDDVIHGKVSMALPDPATLATPLTNVQLTDNYQKFQAQADYVSATVVENGTDVTKDYQLTVKDGMVTATRNDASTAPGGEVTMYVNFKLHDDIPSGTVLLNNGSGTLNREEVPTPEAPITTYTPDTAKHWVAGDQVVDNMTYVNGDTAHANVSMSLPDPTQLGGKLTNVQLIDDFSKFADLVDYLSSTVLENGVDASALYDFSLNDGYVIATRKDASTTPRGTAVLATAFKIHADVPSGTELLNNGSGTLNNDTVPTPEVSVTTYEPTPEKHWTLDGNDTANKLYLSGDQPVAEISVDLPDATTLASKLTNVTLDDDYTAYAASVDVSAVKVLENGTDVSSTYNVSVKAGHVYATRKDASTTPSGKVTMVTTFKIHDDVANGTILTNKGNVTINTDTEPTPETPIIVWQPKPEKDVELGTVTGDTNNSIDGETVVKGTTMTYPLTSDDVPAGRVDQITNRQYVDTLPDGTSYDDFSAWLMGDNGKLTDVTDHIKATVVGQKVTLTEDAYLLACYNQDLNANVTTPIIDLRVKTTADNKTSTNSYQLVTNDHETTSNTVTTTTPDPTPTKVALNDTGVNIDGKNVLAGSVNDYELTWDLSQYKGVNATKESIDQGFYYLEDYPEQALSVDMDQIQLKADGEAVTGVSKTHYASLAVAPDSVKQAIAKSGIKTPTGAFIWFSADDPEAFFKNYVATGTDITINAPMTVKAAFTGSFSNTAYEIDFGNGYTTKPVVNNVPKIDVSKDIVLSLDNQASLNNHEIALNSSFDYKLVGGVLPANEGDAVTEYGWHDDYDQTKDQYNGQYTVLLSTDVVLKDGTKLAKGTDITKYVTTVVDKTNGKIDAEINAAFLATVDFDKGGFGADFYAAMTRIGIGEVTNKYTNTINNQTYTSNTVHSTTTEPKTPDTPKTPDKPATPTDTTVTPNTPTTPVTPAATTPSTPATVTPVVAKTAGETAPAKPTADVATALPGDKTTLPQTGEKSENGLVELGLLLAAAAGTLGLMKLKRDDDDVA